MWKNERLPQKFSGVGGGVGAKLNIHIHACVHTMEYYLSKRKEKQFPSARMNQEGTMLNEVIQTEKHKYCIFLLLCELQKILKKQKQMTMTKQNQTHRQIQRTNQQLREEEVEREEQDRERESRLVRFKDIMYCTRNIINTL